MTSTSNLYGAYDGAGQIWAQNGGNIQTDHLCLHHTNPGGGRLIYRQDVASIAIVHSVARSFITLKTRRLNGSLASLAQNLSS